MPDSVCGELSYCPYYPYCRRHCGMPSQRPRLDCFARRLTWVDLRLLEAVRWGICQRTTLLFASTIHGDKLGFLNFYFQK